MRIDTYTCPECGTVLAVNVLEAERSLKCPGRGCEEVHTFSSLPEDVQHHYTENRDQYQMS